MTEYEKMEEYVRLLAKIEALKLLCRDMWLFVSLTSALVGEIHSREHGTWNTETFRKRLQELDVL